MAVSSGSKLYNRTLAAAFSTFSKRSFSGRNDLSLIDTSAWTTGSGSVGLFNVNESVSTENYRYAQTDPWGNSSMVWESRPSGDGNADGGWNTTSVSIDRTKLYRFSVWVRRTSSTTGGTFYFGTNSNGTGSVLQMADNATNTNPYWECSNISFITQNQWYLVVGHVYPAGTTYTGRHPDSGRYQIATGPVKVGENTNCNIGAGDLKWPTDATTAYHRTYHYYCGDNTSRLQFAFPRIDCCDGTQPSIQDLLFRGPSQWLDISGNGLVAGGTAAYLTTTGLSSGSSPAFTTGTTGILNTDTHSIFFMIKFNSSGSYPNGYSGSWEKIFAYNAGGSDRTPGIWRYPSQRYLHWRYDPANTGTDFGKNGTDGVDFDINTWYYVGVTKNNASTVMYVNGLQVGTGTVAYPKTSGTAPIILYDGYTLASSQMDDLQIYNSVLTADQVLQNFNAIRGRYGL